MWQLAIEKKLENYRQDNLVRQRYQRESPQGIKVIYNEKPCISFCSNDYLGLANHSKVVRAFHRGINKYGVGSGASHLISGHSTVHAELEIAFAKFLGHDRALLFSSGYLANLGVFHLFSSKKNRVFADKYNHASLLDAIQLGNNELRRYQHLNFYHLETLLLKYPQQQKIIVTDSVFSMDGDVANLKHLSQIANEYNALLIVDDAHGIGVLGEHGAGVAEFYNLNQEQLPIIVCPLGKAFGTFGAMVVGNAMLVEALIQFARTYIYSTAIPPALAEATLASLELIQTENWRRKKLNELIVYFKIEAIKRNLKFFNSETAIQIIEIFNISKVMEIYNQLYHAGFLVAAIRPPTAPTPRLRITLTCMHEQAQIIGLLDCLADILNNECQNN